MSMTVNQPAVLDREGFTVRRSIRIEAPLESVWSAVTDPAHISQWLAPVHFDGTSGIITWPDHAPIPLRLESIEPPHSVAYRWNNDDALGTTPRALDEASSTVFTFTLEKRGAGTELTVVETGFERTSDPEFNLASHVTGWTVELDKLVALLEGAA